MRQPTTGTVTFLFTDIESSTDKWVQHPHAMAPALERHDTLVRDIIEGHGGYIFKVVGDAFCAAFDTATAAVAAAVETQRTVTTEDWSAFGQGFPPLRIRMALHTGETQERGQDYFGAPVNRVARLETAANGGQVLMTAATERIVRERLPAEATIRDLGEHRLKDLRYAEHIFQLLAPGMPVVSSDLRTSGTVVVENPSGLALPPGAESILARLFQASRRLVVISEQIGGLSGSRVFKVTPYDVDDNPELSAVVKLAPAGLIHREHESYQSLIRGRLSGIPEIWDRPAYAPGGRWAGIRYALVGGEGSDIESLRRFWGRAELADLAHVLESRLFVHMGALWRQAEPMSLRMSDSYDSLLPLNLVVRQLRDEDETNRSVEASVRPRIGLSPETLDQVDAQAGDVVRLSGFTVEAIEPDTQSITLNLPTASGPGGRAWRLRLEDVPMLEPWQVGDMLVSPVIGIVSATREGRLAGELGAVLGTDIDLDAEVLVVPGRLATRRLPNPLRSLPRLLARERRLRVGAIHGDLNLENVLVDPGARMAHLIDFALAREDHVLHDLLRLEATVLTHLLPKALAAAALPVSAAAGLLMDLHGTPGDAPGASALRSIHLGLVAIRRTAASLLARPNDWTEYHIGLAAYLLGATKYRNLSPDAKRVAFWAAAGATDLAERAPAGNALALDSAMARLLQRVPTLETFRRGRIAEWSGPRYELDDRFVGLELLIDQGEEAVSGRWLSQEERYGSLRSLLDGVDYPALVLIGAPGAGKSTILRHLELETAMEGLRGQDAPLTFLIQLGQYRPPRPGEPPPEPGEWLAERWQARHPEMPPLDELLAEGRMLLLLDALNEMPTDNAAGRSKRVGLWRDWLIHLTRERPGNRVVLSCRSLDYSQPLSTPALRVPQVRIDPMRDAQLQDFVRAYLPDRFEAVWDALAGTAQLEVLRSPFFLRLLVDHVAATGEMPEGRAGLFTSFVRRALRREIERKSPLFEPGTLLTSRDLRRVTGWKWQGAYDLPERGALLPKLAELAHSMQSELAVGEGSQVRIRLDEALALLDSAVGESIVAAGQALAVLEEDQAVEELMYVHQLVQEYFAARALSRRPNPELVRVEWLAARIRPGVEEVIDRLDPADPLPGLPQTGWEETTLLAAAMAREPTRFLRGVMEANLALAGRAATQPELLPLLSADLLDELRWTLVKRSRAPEADLRDRIACGHAVGDLGDPRFERCIGTLGEYRLPPMIAIPGGHYPVGDDEPIPITTERNVAHVSHIPSNEVCVEAFEIAQFPVTNMEWACFQQAGGYEDGRWWDTADGRLWRRGELPPEGAKDNSRGWRAVFVNDPEYFQRCIEQDEFPSPAIRDRWQVWMELSDEAFERAIDQFWRGQRKLEPSFWRDSRHNRPSQPVVDVNWYEARAYCAWLSEQSGMRFRLPTEREWEAAARGRQGRRFPWGDTWDRLRANGEEAKIKRAAPIGVFPAGDTPEGVSDLAGQVNEWTTSVYGRSFRAMSKDAGPEHLISIAACVEDPEARATMPRTIRGGGWFCEQSLSHGAARSGAPPDNSHVYSGFRLVRSLAAARDSAD